MKTVFDTSLVDLAPRIVKNNRSPILETIDKLIAFFILEKIKELIFLDRLEELEENKLDLAAKELSVDYYNYSMGIEEKRKACKESLNVHRSKGTVGAVERVLQTFLPSAKLKEWFEFQGEEGFFKVTLKGETLIQSSKIIKRIESTKKFSQHLQSFEYFYESSNNLKYHVGGSSLFHNISLLDDERVNSLVVGNDYGITCEIIEVENNNIFIPYYPGHLYRVIDAETRSSIHEVGRDGSKVKKYRGRVILEDILLPAIIEIL